MPISGGNPLSFLLKPRNFRIIIFSLGVATVIFALYHLYFNNTPPIEEYPTKFSHAVIFDGDPKEENRGDIGPPPIEDGENDLRLNEPLNKEPEGLDSAQADIGNPRHRHPSKQTKEIKESSNVNPRTGRPPPPLLASNKCYREEEFLADIDSSIEFPKFEFEPSWIRRKEYWDTGFEQRYLSAQKNPATPYLKVFVIPHSHTDPGWLRTFEEYFLHSTQRITDNCVEKLELLDSMTFQFSEMSFLSKWYEHAHQSRRDLLKKHIQNGRIEIVTGAWVMTDEATVNLYSMIDQLIEGQQWVKNTLNAPITSSWSVDPFGHGSTLPYLLKSANIKNMVIQRIHYAWKKWFAENQKGDFRWIQRWDLTQDKSILCHNNPFDIYSIKHSCGPHPQICLNFDFRNISGEYAENFLVFSNINQYNVKEKADLLIEQYRKSATLNNLGNVAMISLGDDFRFDRPIEWDQQYFNYMQLFDYINKNKDEYKAEVKFGTISEYFKAIEERVSVFPTFSGDFFPYSDIFSEGRPAYWTGYFSTRPFWKKFYRETEAALRSAEIIFSLTWAWARQNGRDLKVFNHEYSKLVIGRRHLALFAHHDASTGTSKHNVMQDYLYKLSDGRQIATDLQMICISSLIFNQNISSNRLSTDTDTSAFGKLPKKIPLSFKGFSGRRIEKRIVFYNSLGWSRSHYARVVVTSPHVAVEGADGSPVPSQLNPILDMNVSMSYDVLRSDMFELSFIADLPPLSITVFNIKRVHGSYKYIAIPATVYCRNCTSPGKIFDIDRIQSGDIQLSNSKMQLVFDRGSGLLTSIKKPKEALNAVVKMNFGGYTSIEFRSGAYLMKVDPNSEQKIPYAWMDSKVFIISGIVSAELFSSSIPINISTRIMQMGPNDDAIFIENSVNLERFNSEMFLRLDTDLETLAGIKGEERGAEVVPTFYTDQNGFTIERRQTLRDLKIEGNYYPVNTMSYLHEEDPQGQSRRFSVLVDRAQGFSSFEKGRLESMIERRTIFDDARGMSEGVTDNRETISNYVLLLERVPTTDGDYSLNMPTITAHHLSSELNYPPSLFVYDHSPEEGGRGGVVGVERRKIELINHPLPCDSHLINLRTLGEPLNYDMNFPGNSSLLLVQKLPFPCGGNMEKLKGPKVKRCVKSKSLFKQDTKFGEGIRASSLYESSLTGIVTASSPISDINRIEVKPHEIKSILVEFT